MSTQALLSAVWDRLDHQAHEVRWFTGDDFLEVELPMGILHLQADGKLRWAVTEAEGRVVGCAPVRAVEDFVAFVKILTEKLDEGVWSVDAGVALAAALSGAEVYLTLATEEEGEQDVLLVVDWQDRTFLYDEGDEETEGGWDVYDNATGELVQRLPLSVYDAILVLS